MRSEHINQHNDWATAPPFLLDCDAMLLKKFSVEWYRHQLDLREARHTQQETEIQRYFNSTSAKLALAHLMCLAHHVNELYTIPEITERLFVTRQAAYNMLRECEEAGWIEAYGRRTNRGYRASPVLVRAMEHGIEYTYCKLNKLDVLSAFIALHAFRQMCKSG